jgi:hypothetical protein
MYWTLELASYLSDAPWPANKDELIDYAIRAGAPLEVVENLQSIEDEGEIYESMRFGRITQTKTIFGMRMNIKYIIKEKVSKAFFWLNLFKIIRNTNIL